MVGTRMVRTRMVRTMVDGRTRVIGTRMVRTMVGGRPVAPFVRCRLSKRGRERHHEPHYAGEHQFAPIDHIVSNPDVSFGKWSNLP
jgi:hypothetical protein